MDRLEQQFAFIQEIDKENLSAVRHICLTACVRKMTRNTPGIWR